jgi:hypothetical protein
MRRVQALKSCRYINLWFIHTTITAPASHPSDSFQHITIAPLLLLLPYITKMRFSTFIPALIVPLTMGTPIAEPIASVAATESEYSLLTRDLPADLAVRDPAVSEEQYHHALSKRGCDPIGCYANGFFSVIFNSNGALTLYGEVRAITLPGTSKKGAMTDQRRAKLPKATLSLAMGTTPASPAGCLMCSRYVHRLSPRYWQTTN